MKLNVLFFYIVIKHSAARCSAIIPFCSIFSIRIFVFIFIITENKSYKCMMIEPPHAAVCFIFSKQHDKRAHELPAGASVSKSCALTALTAERSERGAPFVVVLE